MLGLSLSIIRNAARRVAIGGSNPPIDEDSFIWVSTNKWKSTEIWPTS